MAGPGLSHAPARQQGRPGAARFSQRPRSQPGSWTMLGQSQTAEATCAAGSRTSGPSAVIQPSSSTAQAGIEADIGLLGSGQGAEEDPEEAHLGHEELCVP